MSGELLMRFNTKRRKGIVPSFGRVVNEFVELTGTVDQHRIGVSGERAAQSVAAPNRGLGQKSD